MRTLILLVSFALTAFGQRHTVTDVDAETPEGKAVQQIMQTADAAQKTALLEQFTTQFPKGADYPWALEQLLAAYVKANDPEKVLATGERLLAADPDETEAALQCLKASETRHQLDDVKKYSALASTLARKMEAVPQPNDPDQAANWKQEVDYARQVDIYCEYSLYRVFLESRDPKVTVEFGELIPERYPNGQYAGKLDDRMFEAYEQSGQTLQAIALAERALARNTNSEEMLLVVADNYMQNKKEPDKVHAYCARLVELMNTKPKPEGTADEAWTARKNLIIGQAHYMNGKLYFNENHFPQADQELSAALPLVDSNAAAKAETLYLLGYSNYKLQKLQEAANYYRACAQIKSDYQIRAAKNLSVLKTQYTGIR